MLLSSVLIPDPPWISIQLLKASISLMMPSKASLKMSAKSMLKMTVPMTVDVTTGDKITPREIEYSYRLLFDERSIPIMAYNLETILAEKLETVLSRNIANTRPRDFYDVYILNKLRGSDYNPEILKAALEETAKKRGSLSVLGAYKSIVADIRNNLGMQNFWANYQKELGYAKEVHFENAYDAVVSILNGIL